MNIGRRIICVTLPAVLILPAMGQNLWATCIAEAEQRLKQDQMVKIHTLDGRDIEGAYQTREHGGPTILMQKLNGAAVLDSTNTPVDLSEVSTLQYKRVDRVRPKWILYGGLVGLAVGVVIGANTKTSPTSVVDLSPIVPVVAGLGIGLVAGLVTSLAIPETVKLQCDAP